MGAKGKFMKLCFAIILISVNLSLVIYRKYHVETLQTSADLLPVHNITTTRHKLRLEIQRYRFLNESDKIFLQQSLGNSTERRLNPTAQENVIRRLRDLQFSTGFIGAIPTNIAMEALNKEGYESRLPDVILIGAKKCGTNALKFYLGFHPQMCVTRSEVHYYDRHHQHNVSWYEAQLTIPRKDQLVFEKTPRYFITMSAPRNMKRELSGNIKFILLVRDPVERLLSDFRFTSIWNTDPRWRRGQSAQSETWRLISAIMTDGLTSIDSSSPYVYTSNYVLHFQEWLKYFDRSQFLIIDNDKMKGNLLRTLQSVEQFLGLDPLYTYDMFAANKLSIKIGTATISSVITDDDGFPHPVVSDNLYKMLRNYYRPKNKEFEHLSGMTFSWTNL